MEPVPYTQHTNRHWKVFFTGLFRVQLLLLSLCSQKTNNRPISFSLSKVRQPNNRHYYRGLRYYKQTLPQETEELLTETAAGD